MIDLKHVSKSYDGVRNAVDDLTLHIQPGEIFGFLGPNGAGKTTTLKMITGLLEPDQGEISVNGISILDDPIEAKRSFAFVPDHPAMFLRLKGIEYLSFIADVYGIDEATREARIDELTTLFKIQNDLGELIQTYSHGMQQKLILTGALLHNPEAWLLDEPMTGLDPAASFELKQLMRQHADAGKTVLFSTHVLEVAEKICDRLGIIDDGKLLFVGTIDELKANHAEDASLESLFLRLVGAADEDETDAVAAKLGDDA
ncbi:MAG: ABC transporter ATP-binding protein [Saccharofermentanales bacterium]|jgi:ABC-2 type transport system ATP-binding protein